MFSSISEAMIKENDKWILTNDEAYEISQGIEYLRSDFDKISKERELYRTAYGDLIMNNKLMMNNVNNLIHKYEENQKNYSDLVKRMKRLERRSRRKSFWNTFLALAIVGVIAWH